MPDANNVNSGGVTRRDMFGGIAATAVALSLTEAVGAESTTTAKSRRDTLVVDGLDNSDISEGFLDVLQKGGANCVHVTVGDTAGGDSPSFGEIYEFADKHPQRMLVATTVREIRQAKADGKIAFVLGWQESNILHRILSDSEAYPSLTYGIRAYYQLGLRIIGICYNSANMFGGGCLDPKVPLTRPGRRLVEEVHRHRMLLDVGGHTGEQTSLDAIEVSSGVPVVSTHTEMAGLNPNFRCISDRLALAIARTGGVIGLSAISDFMVRNPQEARRDGTRSPRAKFTMLLDQCDYAKRLVGADHVALGPDFVWGLPPENYQPNTDLDHPPGEQSAGALQLVEGFEDFSMLPRLVTGLKSRGWSASELDKLVGGNWIRVYQRVWGA